MAPAHSNRHSNANHAILSNRSWNEYITEKVNRIKSAPFHTNFFYGSNHTWRAAAINFISNKRRVVCAYRLVYPTMESRKCFCIELVFYCSYEVETG